LGGDPSLATPVTTATVPTQCGCIYSVERLAIDWCQIDPTDQVNMGPYIIEHNAGTSFTGNANGGDTEWVQSTSVTSSPLSFNGAYATDVLIPYERMTFNEGEDPPNPSDRAALRYYFVNGLKPSTGVLGAGIFMGEELPQNIECVVGSLLLPTQPDTVAQGYPEIHQSKWYSTVAQSRTFSEEEESRSKILNYFYTAIGGYGGTEEPIFITNANNGERVGVFGNYQRLGLDDDPTGEVASKQQQGNPSRQGFGGLSQTQDAASGKDRPIVFMFDSGRGWTRNPLYPPTNPNYSITYNYSNTILNVGARFNDKFIIGKDSTTRKAIWGGWDNDRDQWLYLFSDTTTGIGVISATSTFTDSPQADGFLDQTDNFARLSSSVEAFKTAIFQPFIMTNELDGLVIMGAGNLRNTSEDIFGYTGDGSDNSYWVYAYSPSASTQTVPNTPGGAYGTSPLSSTTIEKEKSELLTFVIKGTTGRQAEVWVDYILFDGADALIATKLRERGMKVTIEAVEWFKRKIINSGDLNIKQEEIEEWMRQQQDEFSMMMRDAERQGRVRKKKSQVSAFGLDMLDSINTDFEDKEVQEFMKEYLPKSRPPTPEEQMLERQRKGGYSPQTKSYFDEVFEN